MKTEISLDMPSKLHYDDDIDITAKINIDLTNYQIIVNITNHFATTLILATENSEGGSDDQIEITDADEGEFTIHIAKNSIASFDGKHCLKIYLIDPNDKQTTVYDELLYFQPDFFGRI